MIFIFILILILISNKCYSNMSFSFHYFLFRCVAFRRSNTVLCSEPKAMDSSYCNPLLGSFKITYKPSILVSSLSGRERKLGQQTRLLAEDVDSNTIALIGALDEIIGNFPNAIASNIGGVYGIYLRNIAPDMDSLNDVAVGDSPSGGDGDKTLSNLVSDLKSVDIIIAASLVGTLLVSLLACICCCKCRRYKRIKQEKRKKVEEEEEASRGLAPFCGACGCNALT